MLDGYSGNIYLRRAFGRVSRWLGILGPVQGINLPPTIQLGMDAIPFAANVVTHREIIAVGGDGTLVLATVPAGEIWQVVWLWYGAITGVYTIDNLYITDDPALTTMSLDDTDVAAVAGRIMGDGGFMPDIWLYPGELIGVTIKSYVSGGNAHLRVRVRKFQISGGT